MFVTRDHNFLNECRRPVTLVLARSDDDEDKPSELTNERGFRRNRNGFIMTRNQERGNESERSSDGDVEGRGKIVGLLKANGKIDDWVTSAPGDLRGDKYVGCGKNTAVANLPDRFRKEKMKGRVEMKINMWMDSSRLFCS